MFVARSFDINKPGLEIDKLVGGILGGALKEGELKINDKIEIIPAHCMTSFFGCFGSKSGFDSLKDCFKDKVNKMGNVFRARMMSLLTF